MSLSYYDAEKERIRQETLGRLAFLVENVNTQATRVSAFTAVAFTTDVNGKPDLMIEQNIGDAQKNNWAAFTKMNQEFDKAVKSGAIREEDRAFGETQQVKTGIYRNPVIWVVPPIPPAVVALPPPPPEVLVYPPAPNPVTQEPLIPKAVIDSAIKKANTFQVKPSPPKKVVTPVFISKATFKAGSDKAANARGAAALAAAAKKAANTVHLTDAQTGRLMDDVAKAIKNNTTVTNKALLKPRAQPAVAPKPVSRPPGSSNVAVTGGAYPLPNGKGVGKLPPGAVSSPSAGCFKDKGGATFCT